MLGKICGWKCLKRCNLTNVVKWQKFEENTKKIGKSVGFLLLVKHLPCHIISDFKESVCASSFSMHNALGDSFSGEVCQFVEELEILGKDGSTWASSKWILVVVNGRAWRRRNRFLFHRLAFLLLYSQWGIWLVSLSFSLSVLRKSAVNFLVGFKF